MRMRRGEQGGALVYILIAIALLAALTMSFMEPSSQQTSSQNTFKSVTGIQSQADLIRSTIQQCVLAYPGGDSTINSGSTTDAGARTNYPLKPNSTHFTGTTPAPTAGRLVKDLRCPGNPGDDNDHAQLFGGTSGRFMPAAPALFEDWQYYNGTDGVYYWIETTKSDAFINTALTKLDDQYAECEADVIDATGGAVDLDSASTAETECTNGSICFRVWMILNASAVHQDAGCP